MMDNEIGTSSGRQSINENGALSTTEVVNGTVYLRGDRKAITSFFQLPTRDPQAIANRWISITPSEPGFAAVSAAVTLASDFSQIKMTGPFTKGHATSSRGVETVPIYGYVSVSPGVVTPATLVVSLSGVVLPSWYSIHYKGRNFLVSWNEWGRVATIPAPLSSTPITTVLAH